MGDELEIRSGGAVAVDSDTLRHAAARITATKGELEELGGRLSYVQHLLWAHRGRAGEAADAAALVFARLADAQRHADELAGKLESAAAVYELVELNVRHAAALLAGDTAALARIDVLREQLMGAWPDAMEQARGLELERAVMWPSELARQSTLFGFTAGEEVSERGAIIGGVVAGLPTLALAAAAGLSRVGLIEKGDRLTGGPAAVTISRLRADASAKGAPTSLASVARRIPSGDGSSRVRVEKYTMPDGRREFAVYVAGMQSQAFGRYEAWDNASNTELYTGRESASYTATVEALEAAGARPGDTVHAFGFSQGAMIASHLAVEGEYDVQTLVTYGSPVEADAGPGTLSVGIRHSDDPVTALAGGGHMTPVGASGSVVVERVYDPAVEYDDALLPAHRLTAYVETAALTDASDDPRLAGVQEVFARLGGAASVEVSEFGARRIVDQLPSGPPAGSVSASSGAG